MKQELTIKTIDEISVGEWNDYILKHPNGTFFQTTDYLFLHKKEYKTQYFGLAVYEKNNLCGLVGGIINYNYCFPVNFFTKRAIIIGGPLYDETKPEILDVLLKNLIEYLKNRSIYIQIRNLWDVSIFDKNFETHKFQYIPHLDIIHDLTKKKEEIKSNISKNKRGNISKSTNKGTVFEEIKNKQDFDYCVELVHNTYKRVGLPCPSKKYFNNVFNHLYASDILKVFVAKADGLIIGARMELCYKDMIYDWYAGADEGYKNRYPNDFIPYNILLYGKNNGYKKFDFGGAGKPNVPYGVREHKLKFGGVLVSHGRYERINNMLVYFFSKQALSVYQLVKSKIHKKK